MKAHVEATPKIENLSEPERGILFKHFYCILKAITTANSRSEMMGNFTDLKFKIGFNCETHHFHWHFGGSHTWVKQRGHKDLLIIVPTVNEQS